VGIGLTDGIGNRELCAELVVVITLSPDLQAAIEAQARREGIDAEQMALKALRDKFLRPLLIEPRDEWERRLLGIGVDCGVSLTDEQVSRDAIYD